MHTKFHLFFVDFRWLFRFSGCFFLGSYCFLWSFCGFSWFSVFCLALLWIHSHAFSMFVFCGLSSAALDISVFSLTCNQIRWQQQIFICGWWLYCLFIIICFPVLIIYCPSACLQYSTQLTNSLLRKVLYSQCVFH